MDSNELTATAFVTARLTALALIVAGIFYTFQADWLGWSWVAEQLGGETRLLSIGVGCVFFLLASQALENSRLRLKIAELLETFRQLLYGKDYRNEREMISVLIEALGADDAERRTKAHEHLQRLTGKSFAADPGVWASWWKANERYFELKDRPPKKPRKLDGSGGSDSADAPSGLKTQDSRLKTEPAAEDDSGSAPDAAQGREPPRP